MSEIPPLITQVTILLMFNKYYWRSQLVCPGNVCKSRLQLFKLVGRNP